MIINNLIKNIVVVAVMLMFSSPAWSGQVGIIVQFSPNTTAKASEVNANISEHTTQINDNDANISTNTTNIGLNSTAVGANATNISGKQDRVTGACVAGHSIRVINADGTVVCQIDNAGVPAEEIMPLVLKLDGPKSTLDADTVDGFHASEFMSVRTDNWVNTSGDSMTGDLIVGGNVGIGSFLGGGPVEKLEVEGNAIVTGDLTVAGTLNATISGTVDVTQITGLLGSGFTLQFPDILNNMTTLEIAGIFTGDVVVINGPGYDIERVPGFDLLGRPNDMPGFSQEHPFVFETTTDADAATVMAFFDQTFVDLRSMSLIVFDLDRITEVFRWNMLQFKADNYVSGVDGRTRFTFVQNNFANNILETRLVGPFGSDPFGVEASYNPATDTLTEISGITAADFYPQVEIDEVARTMTLTYDVVEGRGIYGWVRSIIQGLADKRSGSVIQQDVAGFEISRNNYFGMFPIKYEQFYGYGSYNKIKARVVISFDFWQVGI